MMELCQPKRRKTQKGKRFTERERERGETLPTIIKTQKPFKSSPNFVADSVTPKRSQRNEILFGFFFVCVPPSTPAKEDTRPSRQWRSSRRAESEKRDREKRGREEQIMQLIIIHSNVTQSVSKPRPMQYASRTCRIINTHTERERQRDTEREREKETWKWSRLCMKGNIGRAAVVCSIWEEVMRSLPLMEIVELKYIKNSWRYRKKLINYSPLKFPLKIYYYSLKKYIKFFF